MIAWLNSDDVYPDQRVISKCVGHFRTHRDSRFVYGKGYSIDQAGRIQGEERYVTDHPVQELPELDMILQPAAFWRREVYETIGLLDESLHYVLDWEYWLRCQHHFRLDFLNEFLACNRRYESTKTETGGIVRKREIAQLLLSAGNFTERAIQAYLAAPPGGASPSKQRQTALRTLLTPSRYLEKRIRHFRKAMLSPVVQGQRLPEARHRRAA